MKDVVNQALKQDFSSHAVLGRVLFGVAFLVLGLYSILNAKMLANYAPSFIPEILAPVVTLLVGVIYAAAGFGVATGKAVARSATAIALVWIAMAIFGNLLSGYFDIREFFMALGFVGAALVIKAHAEENPTPPVQESSSPPEDNHNKSDGHDMHDMHR